MAVVTTLQESDPVIRRNPSETECSFRTGVVGGELLIQLESYGSSTRKFKNQPSQTLQFDRDTAEQLIELLQKALETHRC